MVIVHVVGEATEREFLVIHPLDDAQEQKIETGQLGTIRMTPSVRLSLLALRGYLVMMILLVMYHVLDLAGMFGKP